MKYTIEILEMQLAFLRKELGVAFDDVNANDTDALEKFYRGRVSGLESAIAYTQGMLDSMKKWEAGDTE